MELWTGMCGDRFPCFEMLSDRGLVTAKGELKDAGADFIA